NIAKIKKIFEGAEGISKVVGPDQMKDVGMATPAQNPKAADMVLFAKDGYIFGDTAAGALSYFEKPERKGSHGHEADLANLHATFIAWGVGIRPGVNLGKIQSVDVAPTIGKLLGIGMEKVDGRALGGALGQ